MRKTSLFFLGAVSGAALTLMSTQPGIVSDVSSAKATGTDAHKQLGLFSNVFARVRAAYVEKPDDGALIESAINGMLTGLDPHSSYMDAESFRDMQVETRGTFGGFGIEVTMDNGLIKVVAPFAESPAAKAGVMANDLITYINNEPVQGLTLSQAVDKMRGPPGTKIKIRIMRNGHGRPIEMTLIRDIIKVPSVRSHSEGDDVGYIGITQFNEPTAAGSKKAIAELTARNANRLKGFILDLRNNPGGLLDQAISVSNDFLKRGEIVSIRGRPAEENQRFNARAGGDLTRGKPLIVLINGGSASASEIVAGALQDNNRATILGTRSFGKGSVQTVIPLGVGNGALILTTARYFTPSGHSIQAKGIVPDIEVLQEVLDEFTASADTTSEASLRGHLSAEGREQTGSQSYVPSNPKDDKALQLADDLIRGRQVNPAFPPNPKQATSEH
jgi:carboxyl-terminal processing protease